MIEHCTLLRRNQTCNGLAQFLLTGTCNACNAKDLAGTDAEAHVLKALSAIRLCHGQVDHLQNGVGIFRLRAFYGKTYCMTHHQFCKLCCIHLGSIYAAHTLAFSQNSNTVRNGQHFIQLMGNDDNCTALTLHLAKNTEQLFGFLRGQNSGRLIQNQDFCTPVQHLQNFNSLFFRHTHLINRLFGINFKAVLFAQVQNFMLHGTAIF
ncbi:hypothetical protein EVA_10625 [gut metagenome]|uniref:Uncharacterized protein n=1 Tax=gut metagenome TaxID=749906 RepID=J9G347_9ZZZZ